MTLPSCSTGQRFRSLIREGFPAREARAMLPRCICPECRPKKRKGRNRERDPFLILDLDHRLSPGDLPA